jgi:hypothetical protein
MICRLKKRPGEANKKVADLRRETTRINVTRPTDQPELGQIVVGVRPTPAGRQTIDESVAITVDLCAGSLTA